jgi:hypothetical protein
MESPKSSNPEMQPIVDFLFDLNNDFGKPISMFEIKCKSIPSKKAKIYIDKDICTDCFRKADNQCNLIKSNAVDINKNYWIDRKEHSNKKSCQVCGRANPNVSDLYEFHHEAAEFILKKMSWYRSSEISRISDRQLEFRFSRYDLPYTGEIAYALLYLLTYPCDTDFKKANMMIIEEGLKKTHIFKSCLARFNS